MSRHAALSRQPLNSIPSSRFETTYAHDSSLSVATYAMALRSRFAYLSHLRLRRLRLMAYRKSLKLPSS